jgi:hypothetical protein
MRKTFIAIIGLIFTFVLLLNSLNGVQRIHEIILSFLKQGGEDFYFAVFYIILTAITIILIFILCFKLKMDILLSFSGGIIYSAFLPLFVYYIVLHGSKLLGNCIGINNIILASGFLMCFDVIILIYVFKKLHGFYEGFIAIPCLWIFTSGIIYLMNQKFLWFSLKTVFTISLGILIMLSIIGWKLSKINYSI